MKFKDYVKEGKGYYWGKDYAQGKKKDKPEKKTAFKYHLRGKDGNARCGAVKDRPDTFIYDKKGFLEHHDKGHRCTKCMSMLRKEEKYKEGRKIVGGLP